MARKRNFGWIIWLVVLGGIGYGGYYGWQKWEKKNAEKGKPVFNTAKIERGDIVQQVTASGTLNPVVNVQVGSQISGLIKKLHADFNSKVKAGDVVAEIDPATYQTRLLQAEADLSSAQASMQLAEVNAKRATELFKEKLVSESEYDTAQVTLTQAKATVQTRKAQVNSAKVDLERCTIVAPIDGIVIDRKVDVGQTVAASMNAPLLFMIANDLTKMQINASVAEADIGNVETNQAVKFTVDAFPGREFAGQVSQVRNSPISVQNVVTYDTIIMVDNYDGKLKPGMTANVQIITSQRPGVVRIPNSALRFKPAGAPTAATTKGGTNATASAAKSGEDIPQTPDAMIARVKSLREKGESMSDEMRAKMGEMMKSGAITPQQLGFGGGPGKGKGGGGKSRQGGGDRPATRTIYVVDGSIASTNLTVGDMKPVTIKTGIADSIYTEVMEGLKEGDVIVTGQTITGGATTAGAPQATNPFASGGGGFGGGRGPR
ncbi:MAG TPA: efflux RND transporter periplasmic adaptor subunit [Verrucomicrobiae bacterium]